MKYGLEPVLFPEKDVHALFRLAPTVQDPLPIVEEFLRRAWRLRLLDKSRVVGRVPTPLGHAVVLEDGRLHASVFLEFGGKTYASRYTLFPSLSNLRQWYRLAGAMGDARLMGVDPRAVDPADMIPQNPKGLRWCQDCGGINPLGLKRCIWCRQPLLPAHRLLPEGSGENPS